MDFNTVSEQLKQYIKTNSIPKEMPLFFSNPEKVNIDTIVKKIKTDIDGLNIDELSGNKKIIKDNLIEKYIKENLNINKTLFSGGILYIYDIQKENIDKANKTIYFLLLQNILFNLFEIIDNYKQIDGQINKQTVKDIIIIIFFSIIISAAISYSFYFYLGKFFS